MRPSFFLLVFTLSTFTTISTLADEKAELSAATCGSPLGTILGWSQGVPAYSNCNDDTTTWQSSYLHTVTGAQVFPDPPPTTKEGGTHGGHIISIGMTWQCVEYARRYLFSAMGVAFGDVDSAWQIWELPEGLIHNRRQYTKASLRNAGEEEARGFGTVASTAEFSHRFEKHQNGFTTVAPQIGDVLIWEKQDGFPHGHVAVVVGLSADFAVAKEEGEHNKESSEIRVEIGEQNYDSLPWDGRNYSRALVLEEIKDIPNRQEMRRYELIDNDGARIVGWLRPVSVDSPPFDEPLFEVVGLEALGLHRPDPSGRHRILRERVGEQNLSGDL